MISQTLSFFTGYVVQEWDVDNDVEVKATDQAFSDLHTDRQETSYNTTIRNYAYTELAMIKK